MCYDELETISAAVRACEGAKQDMERFFPVKSDGADATSQIYVLHELIAECTNNSIRIDASEVRDLLELRMKRAAARLQEVGFRGPLAKAAPADAAETTRVLNAR